jgi:hypothetical protein
MITLNIFAKILHIRLPFNKTTGNFLKTIDQTLVIPNRHYGGEKSYFVITLHLM